MSKLHVGSLSLALALVLGLSLEAAGANESLTRAVERALSGAPSKARVGARFETLGGEVLCDQAGTQPLIPASNMKLVTTASGLALLGPDFAHETRLVLAGGRQAGKLHRGDAWLLGSGDPTLSYRFDEAPLLDSIARAFQAAGIERVEGDLVIDARAFDEVRLHPAWEASDAEHWYGAEVSALVLNDNCLDVTVAAGPKVTLAPATNYVRLLVEAHPTSARKEHAFSLVRAGADTRTLIVRGKVWSKSNGLTRSVPVVDPAAFYGVVLRARLEAAGITVTGTLRKAGAQEATPEGFTLWRRLAPLPRTLGVINQRSHNLYAECLFKTIGRLEGGAIRRQGTWPRGAEVVTAFARAKLSVPPDELRVSDGSGLSRENLASPRVLCRVIRAGLSGPGAEAFRESLARPGEPGTLKRRLGKLGAGVQVRAKTGTLTGVSALSGVIELEGREPVVFSLVMNGPGTSRRYLDQALQAAIGALR